MHRKLEKHLPDIVVGVFIIGFIALIGWGIHSASNEPLEGISLANKDDSGVSFGYSLKNNSDQTAEVTPENASDFKVVFPSSLNEPIKVNLAGKGTVEIQEQNADETKKIDKKDVVKTAENSKLIEIINKQPVLVAYQKQSKDDDSVTTFYTYQNSTEQSKQWQFKHWILYNNKPTNNNQETVVSYKITNAIVEMDSDHNAQIYFTKSKERTANTNPDFIIPKPYLLKKDGAKLDLTWTYNKATSILEASIPLLRSSDYPIAFDPSILQTDVTTAKFSGRQLAMSAPYVTPPYVDDVFSTYLYTGNGTTQTITNGINLSGNGGMVWIKSRNSGTLPFNLLYDTSRGDGRYLSSNQTSAQTADIANTLDLFNVNGFSIGSSYISNESNINYASWTFRESPKFFDIVTYTGDGTTNRQINHSLGLAPGMIITKSTSTTGDWNTYHISATGDLAMNTTAAQTGSKTIIPSATSTKFTVSGVANTNGVTYVAYLYAHDTNADGVIQCGSFTTGSSTYEVDIILGWEPQWIIHKRIDGEANGDWKMVDNMRGMSVNDSGEILKANLSAASDTNGAYARPNATGVKIRNLNDSATMIYCAIRRPNKPVTSVAQVYQSKIWSGDGTGGRNIALEVEPDLLVLAGRGNDLSNWGLNHWFADRLRGLGNASGGTNYLVSASTVIEASSNNTYATYISNAKTLTLGAASVFNWNGTQFNFPNYFVGHFFKRAPGFFDVVAYTGNGVAGRAIPHNLGIAPGMIIIKRTNAASSWNIYHRSLSDPANQSMRFDTSAVDTTAGTFGGVATDTVFYVGNSLTGFNNNGDSFIAYLFATLPGISKVGSYTGTASQLDIDAGFTTGPAFLLIKRTDSTGDWYLWDSTRGIISAGNDPYLLLNSTAAEVTTTNYIDPINQGFRLTSSVPAALNASGGTYIYYAVAKP